MLVANSWRNLRAVTETSRKSATQDVTVYKTAQQNASSSGPQSRPLSTRTSEFGSECVSQGRANDFLASAGIHSRAIHTPCPTSKGRIVCEVQDGAPTLMAAPPTYLSQLPGADSAYARSLRPKNLSEQQRVVERFSFESMQEKARRFEGHDSSFGDQVHQIDSMDVPVPIHQSSSGFRISASS